MTPPALRRPVGTITRGTTGVNRLRRIDRWLTGTRAALLRDADDPLVVDLGFGATPVTALELAARLRAVRPDVEVVGLEIDPERVATARSWPGGDPGALGPDGVAVRFERGGFELGAPGLAGRRPVLVRAANVLRQYPEADVADAWAEVGARLAPGGLLVDATCDELGRRHAWLAVGAPAAGSGAGPGTGHRTGHRTGRGTAPGRDGSAARAVSLTLSLRRPGAEPPSAVAERLPKSLIHHNTPGEPVHAWLAALDAAWLRAAPLAGLSTRQRWRATCADVAAGGWPVLDGPSRWRLGEITVAASAVGL